MTEPVIPERWRVVYEAMKPLADRQGASFQFARDKCALIESLGTAESLVRDLARALQDIEWCGLSDYCLLCGRTKNEGHNSVCRFAAALSRIPKELK